MTAIRLVSAAFLTAVLSLSTLAFETAEAQQRRTAFKKSDTHVYLMRGLFGVFSLGMDDLAGKLHSDGYRANIYGWDSWEQVAETIERNYQSGQNAVAIVGHSLGANAVILVSERLQRNNVPVMLAVTFDATDPHKVPMNVGTFLNFWARDGFGHPVEATPGYKGELDNFDLSGQPNIDHTSIDALDQFHRLVIAKLDGLTSK
jgi:hypothetical protein